MKISHAAHNVTKVIITSEQRFQNNGSENIARDIVIEFADGSTQTIDLYADKSVSNLTVEIK